MAGIYLHIPFCKRACTYCDFHFSTSAKGREALLDAVEKELLLRSKEIGDAPVSTIYFGGGTPSLLEPSRIASFIQLSRDLFRVQRDAEVTLEANPDDITAERLEQWKSMGITRLSLGTQSFRADRLTWMGRAHNAEQALKSIALIAKAGFASWTIDLIYGLPQMTLAEWEEQLTVALDEWHAAPERLLPYGGTEDGARAPSEEVDREHAGRCGPERAVRSADGAYGGRRLGALRDRQLRPVRPPFAAQQQLLGGRALPRHRSFGAFIRRQQAPLECGEQRALRAGCGWKRTVLGRGVAHARAAHQRAAAHRLRTSKGVELARLELDVIGHQRGAVERWSSTGHLIHGDGRLVLTRAGRHFADRIASDLFVTDDDR
ncbi:MAG: radical SAM protein [Flavobacteriales bacterium]|nr:radical SAM protein [Flavobacteriales bacterium]